MGWMRGGLGSESSSEWPALTLEAMVTSGPMLPPMAMSKSVVLVQMYLVWTASRITLQIWLHPFLAAQ